MPVLDLVAPRAVPVLEIHPQVLDGLAGELAAHPGLEIDGICTLLVHQRGEHRPVLVQRGERCIAPIPAHRAPIAIGRHVHRVDRLATRTIAGKLPSERGVGAGKPPVEVVAEPIEVDIGADRHRYLLRSNLLSCGYYLSHNGSQRATSDAGGSRSAHRWYEWGC